MKQLYRAPSLVTYGRIDEITLGAGGNASDISQNNNIVGECPATVFTSSGTVFQITSCSVVT